MGWNQAGNDMDITWYGNPVFDDADGSLRIAGTGQYGIVDRGAQGFNFAGEFTIEFDVNFGALAVPQAMISYGGASPDWSWYFVYENSGGTRLTFARSLNGTTLSGIFGAWSPVIDTWYRIGVSRNASDEVSLYIDGTRIANDTYAGTLFNTTDDLIIGRLTTGSFGAGQNRLRNIRITDGVARFEGASYTPDTFPAPTQ